MLHWPAYVHICSAKVTLLRLETIIAAHLTSIVAFRRAQFLGRSSSSPTLMMSRNYVWDTIFSLTTSKWIPAPLQLSPMAAASACQHASISYRNGVHHACYNLMHPRQSLSGSALELLCPIWYRKIVSLSSALSSFNQLTSFMALASCSTVSELWIVMSLRQSVLFIIFDGYGNSDATIWNNCSAPSFLAVSTASLNHQPSTTCAEHRRTGHTWCICTRSWPSGNERTSLVASN